jgi:hypothetical protein
MTSQELDTPQSPAATAEIDPMQALAQEAGKARSWFAFIAALSVVNTVLTLANVEWGFVIGLGITQIVDAFILIAREEMGRAGAIGFTIVALFVNLFIIGLVMLVWWLSGRGSTRAYLVGMICYALDGLIFMLVGDWFGVAFHVFFLIGMWKGYGALRALAGERAREAQIIPGAPVAPLTPPAP